MERELRYDVVVAGGGSAGVAAAIGARRAGAGTLLLERSPYLGGQATHSLVPAYCGFCTNGENWTQVVKGVGQLVLDRLADMDRFDGFYTSPTGNLIARVDPEAAKLALDQLVEEEKVDCLLYAQVIGARSQGGKVLSLECVDDAGRFFVTADAFVDATGDANLAYLAGAPVEFHCDQTGSMMFRLGGVEPGADLSPDAMQSAINAARDAGAEGFSATRGTAVPVPGCDDFLVNLISLKMPDIDARTLTAVEREGRRQARLYLETFKKHIPGLEHAFLVQTGPRAGFRESRRIIGEYTLTREDVKTSRKDPTGIARGGWGAEIHVDNDDPAFTLERGAKWFDIPIAALRPRGYQNLWCAGRTISSDLTASASIRVMGTGFATGHAAGVAAALSAGKEGYDTEAIRAELTRQGALI